MAIRSCFARFGVLYTESCNHATDLLAINKLALTDAHNEIPSKQSLYLSLNVSVSNRPIECQSA
jgi:hypothetical protein